MADQGDQVALTLDTQAKHTKAVFLVVVCDALYQPAKTVKLGHRSIWHDER